MKKLLAVLMLVLCAALCLTPALAEDSEFVEFTAPLLGGLTEDDKTMHLNEYGRGVLTLALGLDMSSAGVPEFDFAEAMINPSYVGYDNGTEVIGFALQTDNNGYIITYILGEGVADYLFVDGDDFNLKTILPMLMKDVFQVSYENPAEVMIEIATALADEL